MTLSTQRLGSNQIEIEIDLDSGYCLVGQIAPPHIVAYAYTFTGLLAVISGGIVPAIAVASLGVMDYMATASKVGGGTRKPRVISFGSPSIPRLGPADYDDDDLGFGDQDSQDRGQVDRGQADRDQADRGQADWGRADRVQDEVSEGAAFPTPETLFVQYSSTYDRVEAILKLLDDAGCGVRGLMDSSFIHMSSPSGIPQLARVLCTLRAGEGSEIMVVSAETGPVPSPNRKALTGVADFGPGLADIESKLNGPITNPTGVLVAGLDKAYEAGLSVRSFIVTALAKGEGVITVSSSSSLASMGLQGVGAVWKSVTFVESATARTSRGKVALSLTEFMVSVPGEKPYSLKLPDFLGDCPGSWIDRCFPELGGMTTSVPNPNPAPPLTPTQPKVPVLTTGLSLESDGW